MYALKFHRESKRWMVYDGELPMYSMHCGDSMLIQVEEEFLPGSIELDTEWYVQFRKARFWLHPKTEYKAMPMF